MLPEGEKISISSTTPNAKGVGEMLKVCAPLATDDWRVFGQQSEDQMEYGLFRGSSNPLSIGVDEILMLKQEETMVIKAHQVADQCVQLQSSKGHDHYIYFSHRRQESPPPLRHIDDLVGFIVKSVEVEEKEPLGSLMKNTLTAALLGSHGCILAVTNMKTAPRRLSRDAIILAEPIDFRSMVRQLRRERASGFWLQLVEKKLDLLKGMIGSDGITLFDQYGRLLGYRCFVPVAGKSPLVGGARLRAFNALEKHLGRGLSAIFLQSQDGLTDFRSKENE